MSSRLLAQDEARQLQQRQLQHQYVGTEHLLLALIREGEGIGWRVLDSFGVTYEKAHAEIERLLRLRSK